jgi:cell division protease FtsH
MKNNIQIGLWMLLLTAVGIIGYNVYIKETTAPEQSYTQFLEELDQDKIVKVHLQGGLIRGEDSIGRPFSTYVPDVNNLMPLLQEHGVEISAEAPVDSGIGGTLKSLIPMALILGAWFIFTRNKSGGSSGFGKNKGTRFTPNSESKVTFNDVAGLAEARVELEEIVQFLKHPEKFSRLGGQIPKGVLLQGPPGTGKTLLAKAIAGEASVPFYSMGGSDFVEMFVGVGASRVRELFTEAKKKSPCIIFIDEIDAIGGKRGGGATGGGGDEREQTLNALLVEMDGFSSNETIIIVAATNRPDILDPALLRPGRFDRQVTINTPDVKGRTEILEVHVRKIIAEKNINLPAIARAIPGFSGADIANLVNEAALMAAREGKDFVSVEDFDNAMDKIVMGLERKNAVISEENRRITAYHEAGHAVVAKLLPETDPLHKITIIPRGMALGLTQQLPIDDRLTYSREYIINRIKILMGGRVAEEQIFGRLTTGAANDILTATEIANRLVCEWGMSDVVGPVAYVQQEGGFLGGVSMAKAHSEQTAEIIDAEVKRIITNCHEETDKLLRQNNKFLHKLAEALLVNETVDAEEFEIVFHCYINEKETEQKMKEQQQAGN